MIVNFKFIINLNRVGMLMNNRTKHNPDACHKKVEAEIITYTY